MKVLIVAPLKRKIGAEVTAARPRMVFDLVSGLVARGHNVSILGTNNSYVQGAKLLEVIPKGVVEMGPFENEFYSHTAFLAKQAKMLEQLGNDFDVIHNHCYPEFLPLLAASKIKRPILTTIHAQITPELDEVLSLFNNKNINFVCISNAARKLVKKTKILKVVYNGVDTNLYKFSAKKDDYLLWLGRLSRARDKQGRFLDSKGVRWAIKLARATGQKLLLAGNVEDPKFFEKDVKPYLASKVTSEIKQKKNGTICCDRSKLSRIEWVGPVSPEQPLSKKQVAGLMAKAKAFLMPINWQEPFGLVMAEAQSCGTPVIGFDRGSVKELVKHNKTGFVVKPSQGLSGLKKALAKIDTIKPEDCRKHIEKNFSLEKMVSNYEKTYEAIIKKTR